MPVLPLSFESRLERHRSRLQKSSVDSMKSCGGATPASSPTRNWTREIGNPSYEPKPGSSGCVHRGESQLCLDSSEVRVAQTIEGNSSTRRQRPWFPADHDGSFNSESDLLFPSSLSGLLTSSSARQSAVCAALTERVELYLIFEVLGFDSGMD
jgi:hypothetical protein